MVRLITKPQVPREVLNMYGILKFCSIGALIETYSVLNCFKAEQYCLLLFFTETFLVSAIDSLNLKSTLQSNNIFNLHSYSDGYQANLEKKVRQTRNQGAAPAPEKRSQSLLFYDQCH